MQPVMSSNSYGKGLVRVTKLKRGSNHDIFEFTVDVRLWGDFEASYTVGNNANVIATDTIKNTCYCVASDNDFDSPEQYALLLAQHFVKRYNHLSGALIKVIAELYDRVPTPSGPHPTAFAKRCAEKRMATAEVVRGGATTVTGGIAGLSVLRSQGSSWKNFHRDEFRSLPDTDDRIMATVVDARWTYSSQHANYNNNYRKVRNASIEVFANHTPTLGVQHTVHQMGLSAMAGCPDIATLQYNLPNKHHVPFDLSKYGGRKNKNEIFISTDEPHGTIYESFARSRASKM